MKPEVITKAELSRRLSMSRARVSQYARAGMPVRDDGKLDVEAATQWIARNVTPEYHPRDRGASRAASFATSIAKARGGGETLREGELVEFCKHILWSVALQTASLAVAAGASMKTAYATSAATQVGLIYDVSEYLGAEGFSPFCETDTEPEIWPSPDAIDGAIDWPALAKIAGEKVDIKGWKAFTEKVFGEDRFDPAWGHLPDDDTAETFPAARRKRARAATQNRRRK